MCHDSSHTPLQPHWLPGTLPVCHASRPGCNLLLLSGHPFSLVAWRLPPHPSIKCLLGPHLLSSLALISPPCAGLLQPLPVLAQLITPHHSYPAPCGPSLGCAPSSLGPLPAYQAWYSETLSGVFLTSLPPPPPAKAFQSPFQANFRSLPQILQAPTGLLPPDASYPGSYLPLE